MSASVTRRFPGLAAALLFGAALAVVPAALAAVPSPAQAFKAKTLKVKNQDWVAAWWQWAYGAPEGVSPLYDDTGANAAVGQRGNVWFLCGAYNDAGTVTRTITVPEGTYLFFPIIAAQLDNADPEFEPLTLEEMTASVDGFADAVNPANLTCSVGGTFLTDLAKRRVVSTVFKYVVVPGSTPDVLYNAEPNDVVSPSVSDGYWVMLKPLPLGQTTLTWSGSSGETTQNVTYIVKVEAPAN